MANVINGQYFQTHEYQTISLIKMHNINKI